MHTKPVTLTNSSGASDADSRTGMETGLRIQAIGSLLLRYGLVLVIGWIGLMKFTEYEAKGIQPFVAHSPLMSWMYNFLTVRAFSNALGVVEVAIAILIGLRHWSAKASALGSADHRAARSTKDMKLGSANGKWMLKSKCWSNNERDGLCPWMAAT